MMEQCQLVQCQENNIVILRDTCIGMLTHLTHTDIYIHVYVHSHNIVTLGYLTFLVSWMIEFNQIKLIFFPPINLSTIISDQQNGMNYVCTNTAKTTNDEHFRFASCTHKVPAGIQEPQSTQFVMVHTSQSSKHFKTNYFQFVACLSTTLT